jgi:hypothetical protein
MSNDTLRTSAWLMTGITGSTPGVLELAGGRLTFETDQRRLFDVPLTAVSGVKFPWYYFGGGVKLNIGPDHYRFSFVQPGEHGDIGEGRRAGSAWEKVLRARA